MRTPPPAESLRPFTILVVDDEPEILEFLRSALEAEGYAVVCAADGAQALAAARVCDPDAILLDLWMPVMDGRAFTAFYRRSPGPHAPIIAMSASTKVLGPNAKLPEVFAHFDKPFDLQQVFDAVEQAIAEYRSDAGDSGDACGTDETPPHPHRV